MAIICLTCFPKRSLSLVLLRLISRTYSEQKELQPLLPKALRKDIPVQFTTNKASTIKIAEITGLNLQEKSYTAHIVCGSLAVLLIYFCILREENDIDEILKGNNEEQSDAVTLLKLKVQLSYCEKNNLPTSTLKAKIKELEEKDMQFSPFRK